MRISIHTPNIYAIHAASWALKQLGSNKYPGLCYAFCEDAYELGGSITLDGQGRTAKEAADYYLPHAGADPSVCPPLGSYVFFDCFGELMGEHKNWGHMGLSLGDGRMVHSWAGMVRLDEISAVPALLTLPGWTQPVYTGWCPPELILVGMQEK